MQPLASALIAVEFPVYLVRLPGHGSSVAELARCSWQQWYEAAFDGLQELHSQGRPVATVGLSMGSLIALELAYQAPKQVSCIVALSCALSLAPLWLRIMRPLLAGLARVEANRPALQRALAKVILPKGAADIADQAAKASNQSYQQIPLRALMQLSALQQRVRSRLSQISQPALIVHGARDRTCPPSNLDMLCRRLGSRQIRKLLLERSSHVITVDTERERLAAEVVAFLEATVAGGLSSSGAEATRAWHA